MNKQNRFETKPLPFPEAWFPRILNQESELCPVNAIRCHPENPKEGDKTLIRNLIILHGGFYGFLIVQRSTGHIIAGNHRYMVAVEMGFKELPVCWVDVDDEQALEMVLSDNASADAGTYNSDRLIKILTDLELSGKRGIQATGYGKGKLEELIAAREKARGKAGESTSEENSGGGGGEGHGKSGGKRMVKLFLSADNFATLENRAKMENMKVDEFVLSALHDCGYIDEEAA